MDNVMNEHTQRKCLYKYVFYQAANRINPNEKMYGVLEEEEWAEAQTHTRWRQLYD